MREVLKIELDTINYYPTWESEKNGTLHARGVGGGRSIKISSLPKRLQAQIRAAAIKIEVAIDRGKTSVDWSEE